MSEQAIEAKSDDPPQLTEAESRAVEMGWKPEDEWEGDKSRHLSAEQFLDRNEFLRTKADNIAKAEISRLEGVVNGLETTIKDLGAHLKKADQRALERARKEIEGRMDAAVEDGDTDAYNEAKEDAAALSKEVDAAAAGAGDKSAANGEASPEALALFNKFDAANDWYGADGDLDATLWADERAGIIGKKYQGQAFYDQLTKQVQKKFPDLFKGGENTLRKKAASVEGADTGAGGGKKTGALWDKVDKEGRDAFGRFVEQGLFKNDKDGREKYAADYVDE